MSKKKVWVVELDRTFGSVYFGRWFLDVRLTRDFSLENGKENGLAVQVDGGCGGGSTAGGTLTHILLPGPGRRIKSKKSRNKVLEHFKRELRPVTQKFLDEVQRTVARCVAEERERLEAEEKDAT